MRPTPIRLVKTHPHCFLISGFAGASPEPASSLCRAAPGACVPCQLQLPVPALTRRQLIGPGVHPGILTCQPYLSSLLLEQIPSSCSPRSKRSPASPGPAQMRPLAAPFPDPRLATPFLSPALPRPNFRLWLKGGIVASSWSGTYWAAVRSQKAGACDCSFAAPLSPLLLT